MRKDREGRPRYSDYEPSPDWKGGPIGQIGVALNTEVKVYPAGEGKPFTATVRKITGSTEDRSYIVNSRDFGNISLGCGTAVEITSRNCKQ